MSSTSSGKITITSNKSQPYLFSVTMDSSKKKVKIQAKNKLNSEEQYYSEYTDYELKKINFTGKIKGFYTRLKMGIESKMVDELRLSYVIQSSFMRLILEEVSKYDDETTKWNITLKKKKIEKSDPFTSKSKSSSALVTSGSSSNNEAAMKQIQFVVQQVKEKFANEKEERLKSTERIQTLEQLCTKLTKKLVKVSNDLKNEKQSRTKSTAHEQEQKMQSPNINNDEMENKLKEMKSELNIMNQKFNDIRPKLCRLKTRRDFASEQNFIDYITKKLEIWDANKFGPILVRVMPSAIGKAKHFIGYVGEPQKWNNKICKVQWFGLGKKLPEAVEWKALDVFLPLSSFYYPDCPHARAYSSRNEKNKQQL
eukprot:451597_1